MTRRNMEAADKVRTLPHCHTATQPAQCAHHSACAPQVKLLTDACQEALRPCLDHEYEPSYTQGSEEVHPDDVAMDADPDLVETTRSQEQPTLSSPGPATPGSSRSAATPPPAAASSSTHRYGTRTPSNRTPG